MDGVDQRRERLIDLTFAMRIFAKQTNEDMTVLLSSIKPRDPESQIALREAAERFAALSQQVLRYTHFVDAVNE